MDIAIHSQGRFRFGVLSGMAVIQACLSLPPGAMGASSPAVSLTAARPLASAAGTNGVIAFARTGSTAAALRVGYRVGGSATNGIDYLYLAGAIVIPAGSASTQVLIQPFTDLTTKTNKTVVLTLLPSAAYQPGSSTNALVYILPNNPPNSSLLITSPTNGTTFGQPASIPIQVSALDLRGAIYAVDYYSGSTKIGTSVLETFAPIPPGTPVLHQFTWTGVQDGRYVLTARATDSSGQSVVSAPVTVVVSASPALPTIAVEATRPAAQEAGGQPGTFTIYTSSVNSSSRNILFTLTGTARNGTDYSAVPTSVFLPASGVMSTNVQIRPLENAQNNADKYVVLTLRPDTGSYLVGSPSNAVVTITDKDLTTNAPPTCVMAAPENNFAVAGPTNLILRATTQDTDGWVAQVAFYEGTNTLIGIVTNNFITWPTNLVWTNAPIGAHTVIARATDNRGAITTSAPIHFTISPRTGASRLVIFSPTNDASFTAPATIVLQATATDPRGLIKRVEFYQGSNRVGVSQLDLPPTWLAGVTVRHLVDWTNVAAGSYRLTVQATDSSSNAVVSAPLYIKVNAGASAVFATRALPTNYTPGVALTVQLAAAPPAGTGAYAVEDRPPTGWTVSSISHDGTFDTAHGEVKFGPFTDSLSRTLTYKVTPPQGESGVQQFEGLASADGQSSAIGGPNSIGPAQPTHHPADNNPADYVLSLNELTAYASAWKKGLTWPLAPNPIPIGYVTRAGVLWKGGETYHYDPSVGAPPLCWVNNSAHQLQSLVRQPSLKPQASTASRTMFMGQSGASTATIRISVAPQPGVVCYAVADQPPAGWRVSDLTQDGAYDPEQHQVKWLFLDGNARTLSYRATPPAAGGAGAAVFAGVATFQTATTAVEASITGQAQTFPTAASVPRIASIQRGPNNSLRLNLAGQPGQIHVLEVSTDLRHWTPLTTLNPAGDTFQFTIPAIAGLESCFYRISLAAPNRTADKE